MTNFQNKKFVKYLFYTGAILAGVQSFFSLGGIPMLHGDSVVIMQGLIGFLSAVTATWYQFLSKDIPNKVAISGILVSLVSTLGAVNEFIKVVPLSHDVSVSLAWLVSLVAFVLQILSKVKYVPDRP